MSWDQQLDTASFRGVEFDVQALDDELARRIAEYRYPWRNGADLEDLGREPRVTRLTAVFMGADYEAELSSFMGLVDAGKSGSFVHPVLGTWTARVRRLSARHDHGARDMATVELEVIEDGTTSQVSTVASIQRCKADLTADITQVEDDLESLQEQRSVLAEVVSAVEDAVDEAQSFVSTVESQVEKVEQKVNQVRTKVDQAISKLRKLTDVQNYPMVRSFNKVVYSCQRLGRAVQGSKQQLERSLKAAMPSVLVAHEQYGDRTRAEEIEALNPVRNPFFLPAGSQLTVFDR